MIYNFLLKKYILANSGGQEILNADFGDELIDLKENRNFFLNDFQKIESFFSGQNQTSEFHFEVNEGLLILKKNHFERKLSLILNGEDIYKTFFEFVSEKLGVQVNGETWIQRAVNLVNMTEELIEKRISEINSFLEIKNTEGEDTAEIKKQIEEIKKEFSPEQLDKINKLIDISGKIKALQSEIDNYQSKRTEREVMDRKINEVKNKRKTMKEKLESIKMLIDSKGRIERDLAKFANISQNVLNNSEVIKNQRIESRVMALKHGEGKVKEKVKEVVSKHDGAFEGKGLVVLAVLQIALTLLFYFLTFEINFIVIGLFILFVIIALTFYINTQNTQDYVVDVVVEKEVSPMQANSVNEEKLFVDIALFNALRSELNFVNDTIKERLENKSFEEFQAALGNSDNESSQLEKQKAELEQNAMTSEEYYKKRRELDILKIEKENLEYADKGLESDKVKMLIDLNDQLAQSSSESERFDFSKALPIVCFNGVNVTLGNILNRFQIILVN